MITDCLESLSFCDEIIVIDNDSTDKTREICESLKAKVYETKSHSFSDRRNLGLAKAEGEWVLYLDADERINQELKDEILKIVDQNLHDYYFLKRKNYYLGKNEWPFIEKMQRLFKKEALMGWQGELHETPITTGTSGVLNGFILHFTHRDLESMINKTLIWSSTEAVTRFNQNHPPVVWWRFPRVMLTTFINSYILQGGFRAKTAGLIESVYQSFSIFITYAKLWELQKKAKSKQK